MREPVSLVVVNYGTPPLVLDQLTSLARHDDAVLIREVILVDNGFPHRGDLRDHVTSSTFPFPIQFVQNPETSYASGVNRGAALADAPFLALANSDVAWSGHPVLGPMLAALEEHPEAGIAIPQLVFSDGSWQRSHGLFPSIPEALLNVLLFEVTLNWVRSRHLRPAPPRRIACPSGAFLLVRRGCFDALSGFDEAYGFYGEDVDFAWRAARAGWERLLAPSARLVHVHGASSSALTPTPFLQRMVAANRQFLERHHGRRYARIYQRIKLAAARSLAVAYHLARLVRRTPEWDRRAARSVEAVRALRAASRPDPS